MELESIAITETKQESFAREIELIMNKEKGLSYSALKAFLQSPKHFYKYKTEKVTTPAMDEGTAFHMAILEPVKFETEYWVFDDSAKVAEIGGGNPRGTNAYKQWKSDQIAAHEAQILISKEDYELYRAMGDYLYTCSATRDLMNNLIEKEKPIEFEHLDFKISGKIDGLGRDYIIDLKKVADASFNKLRWIIFDMCYDMQGAIYSAAMGMKDYYLIFIDNGLNVTVVKLSTETLQKGFNKFEGALENFRACVEQDLFNSSYEFYNNGFVLV